MIVVVGSPVGRVETGRIVAAGLSARIAMAVSAGGRQVQIVGRIGDDAAADSVLQDLAGASVGHVAILRDPARPTPVAGVGPHDSMPGASPELDGEDVELALRYLTDFRVIVLVEPVSAAVAAVAARATEWGAAALVVAISASADPADVPEGTRIVRPESPETEAAFAERVAALAIRLDVGVAPDV